MFETEYRIVKGKQIIAYKIRYGLYVFYVLPELFEEGIKKELITFEDVADFDYKSIGILRGKSGEYRFNYALNHSSIDSLVDALNVMRETSEIISFDYLRKNKLIFSVSCNIVTRTIYNQVNHNGNSIHSRVFKDAFGVIDFMIDHVDREFMNSRNIIEKVEEYDGYEINSGFLTKYSQICFKDYGH